MSAEKGGRGEKGGPTPEDLAGLGEVLNRRSPLIRSNMNKPERDLGTPPSREKPTDAQVKQGDAPQKPDELLPDVFNPSLKTNKKILHQRFVEIRPNLDGVAFHQVDTHLTSPKKIDKDLDRSKLGITASRPFFGLTSVAAAGLSIWDAVHLAQADGFGENISSGTRLVVDLTALGLSAGKIYRLNKRNEDISYKKVGLRREADRLRALDKARQALTDLPVEMPKGFEEGDPPKQNVVSDSMRQNIQDALDRQAGRKPKRGKK